MSERLSTSDFLATDERREDGTVSSGGGGAKMVPEKEEEAGFGCPLLRPPATQVQILQYWQHGALFEVLIEDGPHLVSFGGIHDEAARLRVDVVAEDRVTADPLALLACG